ncbi:MAG: magnesium transporter [Kiloniellales bacterium]
MSDLRSESEREAKVEAATGEEAVGLPTELVYRVSDALGAGQIDVAERLVEPLHAGDLADLLESLGADERKALVKALGPHLDPEVLPYLDAWIREQVMEELSPRDLARALSALESDDAVEVFSDLDEDFRHRLLTGLPRGYRLLLEESLSYPEDSAGRLMKRELVAIPSAWSVGETIDYMRAAEGLPDDFYDLYLVNPKHKPVGYAPVSRVLRSKREIRVAEIAETEMHVVPLTLDQEEVAYIFRQYGLASAPVIDEAGRLVGVITVDHVVDVIDEEAEEDIMKLAGVAEADHFGDVAATAKARFAWLVVNLGTAILASVMIGFFDDTIDRVVALAVLMPIVASMGGNAGTQTLTVAVRALAMKDLTQATAGRFVVKEVVVGAINGLLFAGLVGLVVWLWFGSRGIGLVIAAAMVVNMLAAGLFGTLIPLGLQRLSIDPAVASSVFLTTVTDVLGFCAFLGLATLFLL